MYERMLDKDHEPTEQEFAAYCGVRADMFRALDAFLTADLAAEKMMRFPYGRRYGWGLKYFIGKKHICDLFAERDAFTVMLRLSDGQYEKIYDRVSRETAALIDDKYPCGDGGWVHCRVLSERDLEDMKTMLRMKFIK